MTLPLLRRFPGLARLPRRALGRFPTPIHQAEGLAPGLWIKRDDLSAAPVGGNKVRALEFLFGAVEPGRRLVTVGATGSTHALSTAVYGRLIGARASVGLWAQEANQTAGRVAMRIQSEADAVRSFKTPVGAMAWASWRRATGFTWIPAGATSPLGILGHVNAGLELADQIHGGEVPMPARIVVALGTGGTAAGILLGLRIAGIGSPVIGAQVVSRVVARAGRVVRLANAAARLIERYDASRLPRVDRGMLRIDRDVFGGAYGRELPRGHALARRLGALEGIELDATYTEKALAAAVARCDGAPTVFWLTFDASCLAPPGSGVG
ncbi:MAG TPA: pyridoxal-phosphate dependent enzyme [Gemmatimonadaceae bacterium]|nr:pyridoxal-phosphate dependent enzyme [Gemmatimonadaceae bacterium]